MKQTITVFCAFALVSIALLSCNKTENKPTTDENPIVGTWRWTGMKSDRPIKWNDPSLPETDDFFSLLPDCGKDNEVIIKADGTYLSTSGPLKCDPAETDLPGHWSLSGTLLHMKLDSDDHQPDATVLQLDATTFKFSYPDTTDNGFAYVATMTLTRK